MIITVADIFRLTNGINIGVFVLYNQKAEWVKFYCFIITINTMHATNIAL